MIRQEKTRQTHMKKWTKNDETHIFFLNQSATKPNREKGFVLSEDPYWRRIWDKHVEGCCCYSCWAAWFGSTANSFGSFFMYLFPSMETLDNLTIQKSNSIKASRSLFHQINLSSWPIKILGVLFLPYTCPSCLFNLLTSLYFICWISFLGWCLLFSHPVFR